MIIQAGFPQSHDLGLLRQFPQRRTEMSGCFHRVGRMPADNGKDVRKLFGQFNGALAAFEIGPDADDFGDARKPSSGDHFGQFLGELRIIQMRVRIVERRRHVDLFRWAHGRCSVARSGPEYKSLVLFWSVRSSLLTFRGYARTAPAPADPKGIVRFEGAF